MEQSINGHRQLRNASLPVVKCTKNSECPYGITCNSSTHQCDCSDIINMEQRDCSMAFVKQCKDGLFGAFCEYPCPSSCKRENTNGECDRIQGTCDNFDAEQNAVLTASEYWYLFVAAALGLVLLLFFIYLIDCLHGRRKEKKSQNLNPPREARMKKSIASKSSARSPADEARVKDDSGSTFEEPKIEDNYSGLYTSYNTGSVMENNVQPMTDGEDIQSRSASRYGREIV